MQFFVKVPRDCRILFKEFSWKEEKNLEISATKFTNEALNGSKRGDTLKDRLSRTNSEPFNKIFSISYKKSSKNSTVTLPLPDQKN